MRKSRSHNRSFDDSFGYRQKPSQSTAITGQLRTTQYYKRYFDEPRTEQSEVWGTCDYYFETNQNAEVLRQIEVYENGKTLKYGEQFKEDEFGFLADQPLVHSDFENFEINKTDFEYQWQK